jgi:DNA-binding protein H-NS
MPRPTNLNAMTVERLFNLRDEIETTLKDKIAQERRRLENQLATLSNVGDGRMKQARGGGALRGTTVPPKYRNPENHSETWAGRGLKPRWLAAALKKGKKLEHFAIAAIARTGAVKTTSGKSR